MFLIFVFKTFLTFLFMLAIVAAIPVVNKVQCKDRYSLQEIYGKIYVKHLHLIEKMQHFHSLDSFEQDQLKHHILNYELYKLSENMVESTKVDLNTKFNSTHSHFRSDFFCQSKFHTKRTGVAEQSSYPVEIREAYLKGHFLFDIQYEHKQAWACLPVQHLKLIIIRDECLNGLFTYRHAFEFVTISYKLALVRLIN